MSKKLIFIQLNEINFEFLKEYFKIKNYPNLKLIFNKISLTKSEKNYHLLEPWIQWQSIYTGLTAKAHGIFRLGDVEKKNIPQFYEKLDKLGYSIGAISPMNCINRCKNPSYFIPDPWVNSKSDNSKLSKIISRVLRDTVNNNAGGKIGILNYFLIVILIIKFSRIKNLLLYIYYFATSFNCKWRKALFLDLLLHDIHLKLYKKYFPDFSTIFFNAGAHIQHHYFFNSRVNKKNLKNSEKFINHSYDPFEEALKLYDRILGDYLTSNSHDVILATGLTQVLSKKIEYYYRLSNHKSFLNKLKISYLEIFPRMSRDFLIRFKNKIEVDLAHSILSKLKLNNQKIFGVLDKKGNDLFVTLTYNKQILPYDNLYFENQSINFFNEVNFVSLKNGIHSSKGFLFLKGSIKKLKKNNAIISIDKLHKLIMDYFTPAVN